MRKLFTVTFIILLSSCSVEPTKNADLSSLAPLNIPPLEHTDATQALHFNDANPLSANDDWQTGASNPADETFFPSVIRYLKTGLASWYGPRFHGRRTANGEIFDMYAMTAAHKTLPLHSYVKVTNLENQRSVIVRINDRGPYVGNRVIDLSYAAAKQLDMHGDGVGKVEIQAVSTEQALLQQAANQPDSGLYLEIGNFSSKRKAEALHDEVTAHNLPKPEIRLSHSRAHKRYKVQIGPLDSLSDVDDLNDQLAAIGITDTQFVTETKQTQYSMVQ